MYIVFGKNSDLSANEENSGDERNCERCETLANEIKELKERRKKELWNARGLHDEELNAARLAYKRKSMELEREKNQLEVRVLKYKRKIEESFSQAKWTSPAAAKTVPVTTVTNAFSISGN